MTLLFAVAAVVVRYGTALAALLAHNILVQLLGAAGLAICVIHDFKLWR